MIRFRLLTIGAALVALSACAANPVNSPSTPAGPTAPSSPPPFTLATMPKLDGSTANIPLGSLVLQRLAGVPKAQADNVAFSGTSQAYWLLACNGPTQGNGEVLLAYEPAGETKDRISDSSCGKLEYHPIGRDALVFLTNAANPVKSLTTEQYLEIYSGSVTNWSEVGGKDQSIVAFQRNETSGSQALMRKFVMGQAAMAKAPAQLVIGDMFALVDGVAGYRNTGNALGYSVFYYAKDMYSQPEVKMLAANGVEPSQQSIADGSYPYVNDFYAVIRADDKPDSPARQVVAWLESPAGQQAVQDAGYVGNK
ncbi:MAG: substrate-binding domain-containing protein [Actinomycetia bacterium]|nr:substrate-binding domain-containing protein [Actinomycetes bacterium]